MQRLLGGDRERDRNSDFTDETILGSDINRIRHLFYYLRSEETVILVQYGAENYRAQVESTSLNTALLRVPGFEEGALRRCRLKFDVANELYQFEVPVLDIGDDSLTIRIPAYIQSAQRRKYPRLTVDDLFMRFSVVYQPLFGRRGAGQIVETRYPEIITELKKDEPDLYLLNRIVTQQILSISPYFELKMYHSSKPDSFMETMLADLRKTIYIRDVTRVENYYEPGGLYGLANYIKEYHRLLRADSEDEAQKFFEVVRQNDSHKYLLNYVCAPIKVFDKLVGHIYVYATVLDNVVISYEQAHRIDLLAQLLSYAMSKSVIARSYYRHALTKVENISLAGLLFELNDEVLFDYLTFHDRIKMNLQIRHNTLELTGEISRYYPVENGFHIGVRFFKANPDDFRHLEDFLHQRSRTSFH